MWVKRKILKSAFPAISEKLKQQKQKPWCRQFIILIRRLPLQKQKHYCLSIISLSFINLVITYYCEMINPILYFIDERTSSSYNFLSWNKKIAGEYFGPYPHAGAVRETLSLMQKLFPVRQCENSVYNNRSRPCLQYQIGRCSAPCVAGYVSDEEYNQQVELARLFLQGKDQQVLDYLIGKMEQASRDLDFEGAARYRDQIQAVRAVIEKQFVSNERLDDMDIMSIAYQHGLACVQVMFIRQGKVLGNRSYFPKVPANTDLSELAATFVGQFYLQGHQGRSIPNSIVVDHKLDEKAELEALLTEQAGRKVVIQESAKGDKGKYL